MPVTALHSRDTAMYNIVGKLGKKQVSKMGEKTNL